MQPDHSSPKFRSTSWKPGESPNPNGRPSGSRNIRTQEVLDKIKALGTQDPLVTLALLQQNSSDEGIRATAANMLAPYLHSKNATKPVQADPVYYELAITLPRPTDIHQVNENIALLSELKITGKLDVATADNLINDQRIMGNLMVDEAKLLAANGDPTAQPVIRIEGGLPPLPGSDVIMPQLNGNHLELEANKGPLSPAPQSHPNEESKS